MIQKPTETTSTTPPLSTLSLGESPNSINTEETLRLLGEAYDYQPKPETSEKINLHINWRPLLKKRDLMKALKNYDDCDDEKVETRRNAHKETVIMDSFMGDTTSENAVYFRASKILNFNNRHYRDTLKLKMRDFKGKGPLSYICEFDFNRRERERENYEEWNMDHRLVKGEYREQAIGSQMLNLAETFLAERAKDTQVPQVITVETAQADLLIWLMKRGYQAATEEDAARIQRLLSGDPKLTIKSGLFQDVHWYVFEKKTIYENGMVVPEVWSDETIGTDIHYTKSSFRIKLKKEFKP